MRRCYGCIYWEKNIGSEKLGECRRGVPSYEHYVYLRRFPLTRADDWCGEFSDGLHEKKTFIMKLDDLLDEREDQE